MRGECARIVRQKKQKMEVIKNIEQRTEEWYDLRRLKLTASCADKVISGGNVLFNHCEKVVNEFLYGAEAHYVNNDMQRGIDLEPTARALASSIYGVEFQEIGAIVHNDRVLVSPDGVEFVDDKPNKLIEIKCPNDNVFKKVLDGYINPKYYAQIQMQLYVSKATECLYFNYNENIEPFYYGKWIKPDNEMFKTLEKNLKFGADIIDILLIKHFEGKNDNS